jgi:hypothetical protein
MNDPDADRLRARMLPPGFRQATFRVDLSQNAIDGDSQR